MVLEVILLSAGAQFMLSLIAMLGVMMVFHDSNKSYYRQYEPQRLKRDSKNMKIAAGGLVTSPLAILTVPAVVLGLLYLGIRKFVQHTIHIIREA